MAELDCKKDFMEWVVSEEGQTLLLSRVMSEDRISIDFTELPEGLGERMAKEMPYNTDAYALVEQGVAKTRGPSYQLTKNTFIRNYREGRSVWFYAEA
jgi:hypothetical protein